MKPALALGALLLSACSLQPPMQGQLQTKDQRPLLFSSAGEQLLLTPGPLEADVGDRPDKSGHIRLKTTKGEITIRTTPEHFTYNHFLIPKAEGKVSTDLKGVWRENTEQIYAAREVESCTAPGFCPQTFKVVVCPTKDDKRGDACQTHYETRMRYANDCPGQKLVENTYQRFTLSLELDFLNPENSADWLARFQGISPGRKRIVSRQELAPCLVR